MANFRQRLTQAAQRARGALQKVPSVASMMGMPSVMDQERQRSQMMGPLMQQGQFKQAMNLPSAFEGFGTADVGALGGLMGGIKAYHGSPHSFSRFDSKNIGTGEGAQAYGQGLYFAESPGVAKSYRDQLQRPPEVRFGDMSPNEFKRAVVDRVMEKNPNATKEFQSEVMRMAGNYGRSFEGRAKSDPTIMEAAINSSLDFEKRLHADPAYTTSGVGPEVMEAIRDLPRAKHHENKGSVYEVDIDAKPEQFLDWDAPLSRQTPEIQKQLGKVVDELSSSGKTGGYIPVKGGRYFRTKDPGFAENVTGADIMAYARDFAGGPEKAAGSLSGAGVPGIRYKDAMSRGTEEGTSNYVVFPGQEGRVRIDRINDQPTLMGREALAESAPGLMSPRQTVMQQEAMLDAANPRPKLNIDKKRLKRLSEMTKKTGQQAVTPLGTIDPRRIRDMLRVTKDIGEQRRSPR